MDHGLYPDLKIRSIILSRGSSQDISTHDIVDADTILVCESEHDLYLESIPEPQRHKIEVIPDNYRGLAMVRNFILKTYPEEIVVMMDDDIIGFACLTHETQYKIMDKATINQIIANTAVVARDAGAHVFGYNQAWDVRKIRTNQPFALNQWVGGVVGVIGRDLKFDENNKLRVDVDYCLQSMLKHRITWRDDRFSFIQARFTNTGGNSVFRTKESDDQEQEYLKDKWGRYIQFRDSKTTRLIKTKVIRKIV